MWSKPLSTRCIEQELVERGYNSAQISQIIQLLGTPLDKYLQDKFFKQLSDHLNLFMYLPKTPFIWHLTSGPHHAIELYISIYKWSRDTVFRIKSVYIANRETALNDRLSGVDISTANGKLEAAELKEQLKELKAFAEKIDELLASGYDPKLPDKNALLWTNDKGESRQFSFADMKRSTDMTASYFQSLGIGRGDMVMLILKRRYEFWYSTIALHKLGATVIPATHLLTKKDIIYRCNAADIKMIVAAGEGIILQHIKDALPECPTVEKLVSVGPEIPEGFEDFHQGIENAAPFVRPRHANTNDDISLMYFTSGTTGEPKMVAHDFTYPLGHIVTGSFWHNLDENSLHLTIADTGWGKAVWGKLYGQWIAGANIFVYDQIGRAHV